MSFIDRVEKELMSRKLRKSDLAHGAGIPDGTIRSYFKGSSPTIEAAARIAAFLNLSLDFLVSGISTGEIQLNNEERELLNAFRRLDDRDKNAITTLAQSLLSQYSDSTKRTITVG